MSCSIQLPAGCKAAAQRSKTDGHVMATTPCLITPVVCRHKTGALDIAGVGRICFGTDLKTALYCAVCVLCALLAGISLGTVLPLAGSLLQHALGSCKQHQRAVSRHDPQQCFGAVEAVLCTMQSTCAVQQAADLRPTLDVRLRLRCAVLLLSFRCCNNCRLQLLPASTTFCLRC